MSASGSARLVGRFGLGRRRRGLRADAGDVLSVRSLKGVGIACLMDSKELLKRVGERGGWRFVVVVVGHYVSFVGGFGRANARSAPPKAARSALNARLTAPIQWMRSQRLHRDCVRRLSPSSHVNGMVLEAYEVLAVIASIDAAVIASRGAEE